MTDTERELFEGTLRRAAAAHAGDAGAFDTALDELGWHHALAEDLRLAVSVLFEVQGAANATSSALGHVVRAGLGPGAGPRTAEGPAVVLPALGTCDPPGTLADRLSVRGLGLASLAVSESALLPTRHRDGAIALHAVATKGMTLEPVAGLDPDLGLVAVEMEASYLGTGGSRSDRWPAAVGLARMAVGHELVGAAGAMLELARTHALEREQFGRPIAAFQAVRHRLADTLVAIEGARALLDAAWVDRSPAAVAMAKATAGRAARTAARHCQQVLAGMGFTTEHPLHRYVRRVLVLDELFGSARVLTRVLGEDLLSGGPLPVPVPL